MPAFTSVSFSNHDLQSFNGVNGIFVSDIQHAGKSAKRAQTYALSHANASAIPFVEYPSKPITVTGKIVGTSITDCDAQIDLFNSYMLAQGGNLDIGYNGGTRRYIATATSIDVTRPGGLTWANFDVTFTCTQPFGQDTSTTPIFPNLLANGDFEVNTTGWTVFNGSTISQSSAQAFSGTKSLQIVATSGANKGAVLTFIPVSPSTTYTLSAYLFVPAAQVYGFEVDEYDVSSTYIKNTLGSNTGNGSWQRISLTFTTASNTTQIQFFAYLNASVTFYLDAAQLQPGSTATAFVQSLGRTLSSYTDSYTFLGTAPYQAPVFTLTFTAVSAGTQSVIVGNNNNGQQITITRVWTASDVLVIDTTANTVTVNGIPVNFTGAFPQFSPGSGSIGYADSFSSRTFNYNVSYFIRYL